MPVQNTQRKPKDIPSPDITRLWSEIENETRNDLDHYRMRPLREQRLLETRNESDWTR